MIGWRERKPKRRDGEFGRQKEKTVRNERRKSGVRE